jgi:hypothetical protein
MSDTLKRIVMDDTQVIAAADIASNEDDVAEEFGCGQLWAADQIGPFEWQSDGLECSAEVESEGEGVSAMHAEVSFICGKSSACTGIEGAF